MTAGARVGRVEVFGGPKEPVESNDDEVLDVGIEGPVDVVVGIECFR